MLPSPIIIGGTGGSGTRVVQEVFEILGVFMGRNLNDSRDALDFHQYLTNTTNDTLRITRSLDYQLEDLPEELVTRKLARAQELIKLFLSDQPKPGPWGFKHPRSIYMVPYFHRLYPDMTFVHVVRDGRDMAISTNQQQLGDFYRPLFGKPLPADRVTASMEMWTRVNMDRTEWAEKNMKHYFVLPFETLCADPLTTLSPILEHFEVDDKMLDAIKACVAPPSSIGRHRRLPDSVQQQLYEIGEKPLLRYGYMAS